jgi:hypothetical protein
MKWKDKPKYILTTGLYRISFESDGTASPSRPGYSELALSPTTKGEVDAWLQGDVELGEMLNMPSRRMCEDVSFASTEEWSRQSGASTLGRLCPLPLPLPCGGKA